jgi:hypothetical protein
MIQQPMPPAPRPKRKKTLLWVGGALGIVLGSAACASTPSASAPPTTQAGSPATSTSAASAVQAVPQPESATMHQWLDMGAVAASAPDSARRAGLGGLGLLIDAMSEKTPTVHMVSEVRFAGPGVYQVGHRYRQRRRPTTMACDGQRRWEVYADKITTRPAQPPPADIGDLADPSWLLQWTLTGGDVVRLGGRSAYQISAVRRKGDSVAGPMLFPAAVAVVDAELGIILRLTSYIGDNPVQRYELRDVTTSVGDFRPEIPDGLPVVEQSRPFHL